MAAATIPDALPDIRYWLKNAPTLAALHNGRVFFRVPQNPSGFPLLRIYQHGDTMNTKGGDEPTTVWKVSVEAWHNQQSGYNAVRQLVVAVRTALLNFSGGLLNPSSTTVCLSASGSNTIDAPDPETGWPRLVLNTSWVIQAL